MLTAEGALAPVCSDQHTHIFSGIPQPGGKPFLPFTSPRLSRCKIVAGRLKRYCRKRPDHGRDYSQADFAHFFSSLGSCRDRLRATIGQHTRCSCSQNPSLPSSNSIEVDSYQMWRLQKGWLYARRWWRPERPSGPSEHGAPARRQWCVTVGFNVLHAHRHEFRVTSRNELVKSESKTHFIVVNDPRSDRMKTTNRS